jgi:phosphoribosylanthranilate isomerase
MTVAIKICGIKTPEMASACAQAGAQFIGIMFAQDSVRFVDLLTAERIAKTAREMQVIPVGVFTDQDAATMITICNRVGLDYVQLHGVRAKNALYDLPEYIHKIYVNPKNPALLNDLRPGQDFVLLDNEQGGSGQVMDWSSIQAPQGLRFFLAGGLNPENVQQAIRTTHPYGVDVSSGVETTRGVKSEILIQQFIEKVHHA